MIFGGWIISISDFYSNEFSYKFGVFEVPDKGSVEINLVPSQLIGEKGSSLSEEITLLSFYKLSKFIVDYFGY